MSVTVIVTFAVQTDLIDLNYSPSSVALPAVLRNSLVKIKNQKSMELSFLGKMLLCHCLKKDNLSSLISKYQTNVNQKPFIPGWKHFSIAHSGEIATFTSHQHPIGIDIEKKIIFDFFDVIDQFHSEEQDFISNHSNTQQAFFEIWVKKEALLKALGIGITGGLNNFSCVKESVAIGEHIWYFYNIDLHVNYICYICSTQKGLNFEANKLLLNEV